MDDSSDAAQPIADLISAAEVGDSKAVNALFAALYHELHRMARRELARRGSSDTLGVTTLLHEAYLDIANREGRSFPDRSRFMAYASRVMRGVIIDHARQRRAIKRGSGFELTTLDTGISDQFAEARLRPTCPFTTCAISGRATRSTRRILGRGLITGKWRDVNRFKGPVLRGLASRAPYFHNGSAATLLDAVEFYDKRFNIGLTAAEKADLVAFLRSL